MNKNSGPCSSRSTRVRGAFLLTLSTAVLSTPALLALDGWPAFGGAKGDFSVEHSIAWPEQGPEELWRRPLGSGYSAITTAGDAIFTLYRDGDTEFAVALDADTGETRWQQKWQAPGREGHLQQFGYGPHATPLAHGDALVTLGYTGVLSGFDLASGELLWRKQLLDELGGEQNDWGYSASPMAVDDLAVVVVGNERGLIAVEPRTGEIAWQSAPTRVSFVTPVLIDVEHQGGTTRQLLYFSHDALIALDPDNGDALWSIPMVNGYQNHASTPLWSDQDQSLWVVSQQEAGARIVEPRLVNGEWRVSQRWSTEKLRIHHWNSQRFGPESGDYVIGAFGEGVTPLSAVDAKTGEVLFRKRGFPKLNMVKVGDRLLSLDEEGKLSLLAPSREDALVLGSRQVFEATSWTAPTVVEREGAVRVYLRDKREIVALSFGTERRGF